MADRVLSELTCQRGRLILVTGDRHEPTSHELTSPDPLARLLTNLAPATCLRCCHRRDFPLRLHQLRLAGELAEVRAPAGALATSRPAATHARGTYKDGFTLARTSRHVQYRSCRAVTASWHFDVGKLPEPGDDRAPARSADCKGDLGVDRQHGIRVRRVNKGTGCDCHG